MFVSFLFDQYFIVIDVIFMFIVMCISSVIFMLTCIFIYYFYFISLLFL